MYMNENAPDFPRKKNLKAILELFKDKQLVDESSISNIIEARGKNEKRKEAGRILRQELINYHLEKTSLSNTEILKNFDYPEEIYQQSKRQGIIKEIKLKE